MPFMGTRLGQLIRDARHRSGQTLEDVAEKVGVTPGALSHIESGRRLPQSYNAVAIAEALGVPREEILQALDEEHSSRRRSSAERTSRPSGSIPRRDSSVSATASFSAMPVESLLARPSPDLQRATSPRPAPAAPTLRTPSTRDLARWSDDTAERLAALEQLADSAADAIRTLRGLVADDDPAISREARRLLHELDVRPPEE